MKTIMAGPRKEFLARMSISLKSSRGSQLMPVLFQQWTLKEQVKKRWLQFSSSPVGETQQDRALDLLQCFLSILSKVLSQSKPAKYFKFRNTLALPNPPKHSVNGEVLGAKFIAFLRQIRTHSAAADPGALLRL